MGCRGQIYMKNSGVYLYTHWTGDGLKDIVKEALAKNWRWDDEEYLTRIIFDVLTEGDHGSETGYGIGTEIHGDLDNPLITVDVDNQAIYVGEKKYTFKAFIQ